MRIESNNRLLDIIEKFNHVFPYLKIEFYHHQHQHGEGSKAQDILSHHSTVGELTASHLPTELNFDASMKVSDFEAMIFDRLGLAVQVFRKSNNIWLQTISSDHLTLETQNNKAHNSSDQDYSQLTAKDFDLE